MLAGHNEGRPTPHLPPPHPPLSSYPNSPPLSPPGLGFELVWPNSLARRHHDPTRDVLLVSSCLGSLYEVDLADTSGGTQVRVATYYAGQANVATELMGLVESSRIQGVATTELVSMVAGAC